MITGKILTFFLRIICFLLCFLVGYSSMLMAEQEVGIVDKTKILIINTDASVDKYAIVQKEFQNRISYPTEVSPIYLDDEKWQISAIEKFLYNKHPDLIYCIGTKAYLIASKYAGESDIIFSSIINWLRLPLTSTTYGVSNELSPETQLLMFRYVFPDVQRIGILYSKEFNGEWFAKAMKEAENMKISLFGESVSNTRQIFDALKKILSHTDAFWLISDPVVTPDKETLFKIFEACDMKKKPIFSYNKVFSKYGAVLSVFPDEPTIGRQVARIASELLNKRNLPEKVQFPAGTKVVLNLKKIKEYQLKYSEDVLGTVNEIIE